MNLLYFLFTRQTQRKSLNSDKLLKFLIPATVSLAGLYASFFKKGKGTKALPLW